MKKAEERFKQAINDAIHYGIIVKEGNQGQVEDVVIGNGAPSRENSLAITALQEAGFWAGEDISIKR